MMTKKEKRLFIASLVFALLSFILTWAVMRSDGKLHVAIALVPMALAVLCSQLYMHLKDKRQL